jgi:hypothetical protein
MKLVWSKAQGIEQLRLAQLPDGSTVRYIRQSSTWDVWHVGSGLLMSFPRETHQTQVKAWISEWADAQYPLYALAHLGERET